MNIQTFASTLFVLLYAARVLAFAFGVMAVIVTLRAAYVQTHYGPIEDKTWFAIAAANALLCAANALVIWL
jgi:hypothetical protein